MNTLGRIIECSVSLIKLSVIKVLTRSRISFSMFEMVRYATIWATGNEYRITLGSMVAIRANTEVLSVNGHIERLATVSSSIGIVWS